jgi:leader peptidase (prepilin peptidase)/N-methyltransferase
VSSVATTPDVDVESAPGWLDALLPRRDARYVATTAAAGVLAMAVLGVRLGANRFLPPYLAFGAWTAVIAAGDVVTKRIPNKLNAAALGSGLALLTLAGAGTPLFIVRALLGATIAFVVYFVLWAVAPAGMGMGDVKLAPYLGAHLAYAGWNALARGLLYGFFAQAAIVVVLMATRRAGRRSHVPHGPAMCIGAIVSLVSVF